MADTNQATLTSACGQTSAADPALVEALPYRHRILAAVPRSGRRPYGQSATSLRVVAFGVNSTHSAF
jgi:hypothetical protein